MVKYAVGLTDREKRVLQLKAGGLNAYEIARKLRVDAANIYRADGNARRKLRRAKLDLEFAEEIGVDFG